LHFERVRAVDAVKRATMGEFGDEGEWIGDGGCHGQRRDACLSKDAGQDAGATNSKRNAFSICSGPLQIKIEGALVVQ
jgi:hypothetical protein